MFAALKFEYAQPECLLQRNHFAFDKKQSYILETVLLKTMFLALRPACVEIMAMLNVERGFVAAYQATQKWSIHKKARSCLTVHRALFHH